jgi:SAM-dependent methyltransferase
MLSDIMKKHGSDKSSHHHNYTDVYTSLFESRRLEPLRVFELGLGTNFVDVKSNMGLNGKPGASLRGWAEYFPNALVFGADIDKRILFEEPRIKTFYCDQTNPESIAALWSEPDLQDGFDIIVDDGLHEYEANKCFYERSIHKLKAGGYYIVEDLLCPDIFEGMGGGKVMRLPLSTNNAGDNNLLVIARQLS